MVVQYFHYQWSLSPRLVSPYGGPAEDGVVPGGDSAGAGAFPGSGSSESEVSERVV